MTLRYSETGNKKRATRFATLLQNESNTDVARFVTHFRTLLPTNEVVRFVFVGGKKRNIAIQLILQQCCEKSCTFFVALFTVPLTAPPQRRQKNENENEDKDDDENENENEDEDEDKDEKKIENEDEKEYEYEYEYKNEDEDESEDENENKDEDDNEDDYDDDTHDHKL